MLIVDASVFDMNCAAAGALEKVAIDASASFSNRQ